MLVVDISYYCDYKPNIHVTLQICLSSDDHILFLSQYLSMDIETWYNISKSKISYCQYFLILSVCLILLISEASKFKIINI